MKPVDGDRAQSTAAWRVEAPLDTQPRQSWADAPGSNPARVLAEYNEPCYEMAEDLPSGSDDKTRDGWNKGAEPAG